MSNGTGLSTLPSYKDVGPVQLPADLVRKLTQGSDFLPRLQLYQGSSDAAKQKKVGSGNWGIPNNKNVDDLGDSIDIVVFDVRSKALDTGGEKPTASYDADSVLFKTIEEKSTVQDSNCMAGLEFLVFERSTLQWLTYFAYTKSAQFIASELIPAADGQPIQVNLTSEYMEGTKNGKKVSWHAPVVKKSVTPFPRYPTDEDRKAQVHKFRNPEKNASEPVSETEAAALTGRKR